MRFRASALLLILAGTSAWAGSGEESFDFLLLDSNARAGAMGGAYTALASGSHALHYNPAGLGGLSRHEASFMHNEHFEGTSQEYASVALRQGVGFSVNYLGVHNVPRTTINQPGGNLGNFGGGSLAASAAYGRAVHDDVRLGGGVSYLRETIDDVSADVAALSFGGLWKAPVKGLNLGVSLQNIGSDAKFASKSESLPLVLRAGSAWTIAGLGPVDATFALDLFKERSESVAVSVGAEAVLSKVFAARLGFNSRNDAGIGIATGVGWLWKNFSVDYALIPYDELGLSHRVSVMMRWGAAR